MPGERLAKLTLSVVRVHVAGTPNLYFLKLGGAYVAFKASNGNRYFPPSGNQGPLYEFDAYANTTNPRDEANEIARGVDSLLACIRRACTDRNLAYTVSAKRPLPGANPGGPVAYAFDVEAAAYDRAYDLDLVLGTTLPNNPTLAVVANLATIRPVFVDVSVTDAGVYGSPTGAIQLVPRNGNDGVYSYAWDDAGAPAAAARTGLVNATYACTVTDSSGAYAVAQVVVGSDPRLDVLIDRVADDVTLVASGGLAPYAYAWADGPTGATRLALAVGTYACTVTDARGASVTVAVVVDPYRFYWSKNPVLLPLDAGPAYRANPAGKPNLSFVCQVWVEPVYLSGNFVQVGPELEQPADAGGRTTFDVQALLDAHLTEHLPALNQGVATRADPLFRRFYLQYAQKFGNPPVRAALTSQTLNYVVLGGLSDEEHAAGTWFRSYQAAAKPFLTWEPNDKAVLPAQPEYLYFMVDSFALATFQQWLRLRFDDGSTQDVLQQTVTGAQRFEVYCLPAGYGQLRLAPPADPVAAAARRVVAWDVWVSDPAGVAQTEVRRYRLDATYRPQQRFFLYTNSLGGVNTLAALGQAKRSLDVAAVELARPRPAGAYDPQLGDTLTLERTGQPVLAVTTGPRRRAQLVADQELLLARRVTLQSGGQYWAGRVAAGKFVVADEADGLAALEFEFALARQGQFGPRLPPQQRTPLAGGEGAQP